MFAPSHNWNQEELNLNVICCTERSTFATSVKFLPFVMHCNVKNLTSHASLVQVGNLVNLHVEVYSADSKAKVRFSSCESITVQLLPTKLLDF